MKRVKKFIALLGMASPMALLPLGSVAAHAAEPESYSLRSRHCCCDFMLKR